jgi:hypothetical protein
MDWDMILCVALMIHPITAALVVYAYRRKPHA